MRSLKPAYLALIPVLALLAGAWLGRIQLAEVAVSSSMRHYGMERVSVQLEQLGPQKGHLSMLEFSLAAGPGLYRLEAEDISMAYSLKQLSQASADSVSINRLAVYHEFTAAVDSGAVPAALEPVKIIAALRQALREYIVVDELSVNHLALHGDAFGVLQDKAFRLHARNENSILIAELALLEQPEAGEVEITHKLRVSKLSGDSLQAALELPGVAAESPVEVDIDIHDTKIDGRYVIRPVLLKKWLQPFFQLNRIEQLGTVTGSLSVDFSSSAAINTNISARSGEVLFGDYRAEGLEVLLKTRNPADSRRKETEIVAGSHARFRKLEHDRFALADTQLFVSGQLSIDDGRAAYQGSISVPSAAIGFDSKVLQLEDIAAIVSANERDLRLSGNFFPADAPGRFWYSLEHNLAGDFGRLIVGSSQPVDLDAEDVKLSRLWTPWPYPFDLLNGQIRLSSDMSWRPDSEPALHTRIDIDNAGGHYGEIVFTGLSLKHKLAVLPELRSVRPGKIVLSQLDSGVIASNISTTLSLESSTAGPLPKIEIRNLYGEIFDGSFNGKHIVFDLNEDRNQFKITAEDIDLAAVVATQQFKDIEVSGRIDGTIPVSINAQGIFIEHGAFINDVRSGTIRYNPATGTEQLKQNPITGIALDALRDFRYSHLSADVNFTPDGMLAVSLQLKGTSPELDTRRPVHLNINTEQNLLSLLKSLRYAESLGASIDQRVRKKYNNTKGIDQENQ